MIQNNGTRDPSKHSVVTMMDTNYACTPIEIAWVNVMIRALYNLIYKFPLIYNANTVLGTAGMTASSPSMPIQKSACVCECVRAVCGCAGGGGGLCVCVCV